MTSRFGSNRASSGILASPGLRHNHETSIPCNSYAVAGVNYHHMEHPACLDLHGLEECIDRILRQHSAHNQRNSWRYMGCNWMFSVLGHLAGKSMGWENAPWNRGRLHDLVLERTAFFSQSPTQCDICCYSKFGIIDPGLVCQ